MRGYIWLKFANKVFQRFLQLQSLQVANWGFLHGNYSLSERPSKSHPLNLFLLSPDVKTTFLPFSTDLWKQGILTILNVLSISPLHPLPLTKSCSILQLKKQLQHWTQKNQHMKRNIGVEWSFLSKVAHSPSNSKCLSSTWSCSLAFGMRLFCYSLHCLGWPTRIITVKLSDFRRRSFR